MKPVERNNWSDLEKLFESKGAPHYCWCMAWRANPAEKKQTDKQQRKQQLKLRVMSRTPVGLMAYAAGEPVAWCSVGPRDTFYNLGGDENLPQVWSITCFYIRKEYRDLGITTLLITEARVYAGRNGAKFLEAYPVDPESPSYRHMGFQSTFEKNGFNFVKRAGKRRKVMICKL